MKHHYKASLIIGLFSFGMSMSQCVAATFDILFDPNQGGLPNTSGSFGAPLSGGYVSSFSVTIQGFTFNTPYLETDNNGPIYDPLANVIGGTPG